MYLLKKDRPLNSLDEWGFAWDRYRRYLSKISESLPSTALEYATAEWHYNHLDPRAPHDSWIQDLNITESWEASRRELRESHLEITLLGAYHDGNIRFQYREVSALHIERDEEWFGDWQYDEVRLSAQGRVLHEIELDKGSIIIECKNMEYFWTPLERML